MSSVPKILGDADIDNWWRRPVKVLTHNITSGSAVTSVNTSATFVTTWLNDPLVNRMLKSVRLIRPIFKLRIHVTSNPTVYGPIMCIIAPGGTSTEVGFSNGCTVQHIILNSNGVNEGFMTVPWSYPFDYYTLANGGLSVNLQLADIQSTTALCPPPPILRIDSNFVATTQTIFPGISIVVTCWCEEFSSSQTYEPQSGRDEYSKPNISKTSTALAKELDKINNPILAPFTTATSLALKVGSAVSSAFGYSRPINIETQSPFIAVKYGDQYSLNSQRYARRLVSDIKNESYLNDPSLCPDTENDELSFDRLCDTWTHCGFADVVMNITTAQNLTSLPVTPCIHNSTATLGSRHYTRLSFTAACFRLWRCDMLYKIRIDTTIYHSGVLQILWNPMPGTTIPLSLNVTNQVLLDICGTKEIEIVVPFAAGMPWLKTRFYGNGDIRTNYLAQEPQAHYNGELVINYYAPTAGTTNGKLNIWCKALPGANFAEQSDFCDRARNNNSLAMDPLTAVNALQCRPVRFSDTTQAVDLAHYYTPQSGMMAAMQPEPVARVTFGGHVDSSGSNGSTQGESIRSLRPYMKRNMPFIRWNTSIAATRVGLDLPGLIVPPGRLTSANVNSNYVCGNLVNLLSGAFLGWRGAIRYHIVGNAPDDAIVYTYYTAGNTQGNCSLGPCITAFAAASNQAEFAQKLNGIQNGYQNFGPQEEISFELPFQYRQFWLPTSAKGNFQNYGFAPPIFRDQHMCTVFYTASGTQKIAVDTSVGEDFVFTIPTVMPPISIYSNTISTTLVAPATYPAPPALLRALVANSVTDDEEVTEEQDDFDPSELLIRVARPRPE